MIEAKDVGRVNDGFPAFPSADDGGVIAGRAKLKVLVEDVQRELERATTLYSSFHSDHEGHSVIREEFEELWDEIKLKVPDKKRMREEATQLAAMAMRFVLDRC